MLLVKSVYNKDKLQKVNDYRLDIDNENTNKLNVKLEKILKNKELCQ